MRINDDLTKPIIVHTAKLDWVKSPAAGVDRRMLYREGDEVARAIAFVASPACKYMTGTNIVIDGGFTKRIQY